MKAALRRGITLWGVVAAILVVTASPVLADPAVPTNYKSHVTDLDPDPAGLAIQVTGGDAFLVAAVGPGHVLEVPGYFGEPYLRIDADGTVWRNDLSPARFINTDRYGTTIPPEADHTAEPVWTRVGSDGTFAWHDHRTHWMSPDLPPTIGGDRAQVIFPWEFDVFFDGEAINVHGELVWFPSVNPFGPIVLGVVGLAPMIWWKRGRTTLVATTLAVAGALALFVATMQYAATPIDRPFPSELGLPVLAIVLAMGSMLLETRPIRAAGARVLAGIALLFWTVTNLDVLSAPILPSALSPLLERSIVGMVLVAAAGFTAVAVVEAVAGPGIITADPVTEQESVGP